MKKILSLAACLLCAVAPAWALTGDVNGDNEVNISDVNALISVILGNSTADDYEGECDVNGDNEVNISDVNYVINIILNGGDDDDDDDTVTPKDISLDYSDLTEGAETIPEDEDAEDYGDYIENSSFTSTIYIEFGDGTATVTGSVSGVSVSTSGAHVVVTSTAKKVEYVLSGSTTNGSIKFYSEKKFKVLLNGVTITNPTGSAINNQCGKSFFVVLADGTTSTLTDGETYTMVDDEDQKATLFSEGQILLSGSGSLNVYSVGKNCIVSDDYVFIRPGNKIYLNSTSGNGIRGKDFVKINGSVINMELTADGAKGITTDSLVVINGGRTTIINSGATEIDGTDTTATAGIKADNNFTMTAGTLNVKCTGEGGKGMNIKGSIAFTGGELNVVTTGENVYGAPKGVRCDYDVNISAGNFYSCAVNARAMDADGTITVADGYTTYTDEKHLFQVDY